jgi:uncharacterized protein involved in outer membrane biogenesis
MRKWLMAGFVFFLICSALGLYILILLHDEAYVLRRMEETLSRTVSASEVTPTFHNGLAFRLVNFSVTDDPAYSAGDFIRAADLEVTLDVLPLLFGHFRIKKIIAHDPVMTIVRNRAGTYNLSTVGKEITDLKTSPNSNKANASAAKSSALALGVSLLELSNGTIRYIDKSDGSDLSVNRLHLTIVSLEPRTSFRVELTMAVFAAEQNFKLTSLVGPMGSHTSLRDVPLDGELRVDAFDLNKIRIAAPRIGKSLPEALDVNGVYTIRDLKFRGTFNNPRLRGTVEGPEASFRFE